MATIQLKRRTSTGVGPFTGTSGSIKAGEPLVDFNGGDLYISKADKTASSSTPLVTADYLKLPGYENVQTAIQSAINSQSLGTASKKNVGTGAGQVPVLNASGKLNDSIVPKIAMTNTFVVNSQNAMLGLTTAQEGDVAVRTDKNKSYILKSTPYSTLSNWQELLTPTDSVSSVNGKTGTVQVTLGDLGGASNQSLIDHINNGTHMTVDQKDKLAELQNTTIFMNDSASFKSDLDEFKGEIIYEGLVLYETVMGIGPGYDAPVKSYSYGIDKSKVLTPSSTIDGGTF